MIESKKSSLAGRHPRITRENKTIEAMIRMQCRTLHHAPDGLCPDCRELLAYAGERLARCPYQDRKTTCARCLIHCYRPEMRDKIRTVMRFSGPRMIYHYPLLAIYHLIEGMRKEPGRPVRGAGQKRGEVKNRQHV
jgi:hypothetical protein